MTRVHLWVVCLLTTITGLGACSSESGGGSADTAGADTFGPTDTSVAGDTSAPAAFELLGRWATDYGADMVITEDAWDAATLHTFDNDANQAVTQNPVDDPWGPGAFSKLVWTEPDGDGARWLCTVAFGLDTLAEAEAAAGTHDDADPATGGCGEGDFPWTQLTAGLEVGGDWANNYGSDDVITSFAWNASRVAAWDNDANWVVIQSPPDDPYTPDQYARVVWTQDDETGFYYCFATFGHDTLEEARDVAVTINPFTPAENGCGESDFAWTRADPAIDALGDWVTDDNQTVAVGSFVWGDDNVTSYDNVGNEAVFEGADGFGRLAWIDPGAVTLWVCEITRGHGSADAAKAAGDTPDPAAPEAGGCGGQPWTHLSAAE